MAVPPNIAEARRQREAHRDALANSPVRPPANSVSPDRLTSVARGYGRGGAGVGDDLANSFRAGTTPSPRSTSRPGSAADERQGTRPTGSRGKGNQGPAL
ncbi:hypothetical protein FB561_7312 [Kribbella amoyensis]|uniref:Uncharacterized protein n=1 Tax=Kribbella amoyensis TaxID=996641 RepID=A0A561B3I0_9ACTN|nr:hypothetical protein [Kribbella amoyensis]TWD73423.1 hypothetical protein FB561_7312 [Kribbella amoyensis]